ncbi:E3 SUMO-protein ligase ZBED1 [Formica fusca]
MDTPPPDYSKKLSNIKKKSRIDTKATVEKKLTTLTQTNNECFRTKASSLRGPSRTSEDALAVQSSRAFLSSTSLSSESTSTSTVSHKAATCITISEDVFKNRISKLKSHVWDSFTKRDATTAQCQICMKTLKHSGNTTNLMQHLARKHPIAKFKNTSIDTGSKQKAVSYLDTVASKRKRLSENEDSPSKNADTEIQKNVQRPMKPVVGSDQQIDNVFRRAHSFADGGTSSNNITNAILYVLAIDNCPLSTVENEGFRTLMKMTAPRYKIPSRRIIARYMDDKYEYLHGMFKREITQVTALTLTCDIWSDISNRGYLGITVHYLHDNKMNSGCLGVLPLEESHTAH